MSGQLVRRGISFASFNVRCFLFFLRSGGHTIGCLAVVIGTVDCVHGAGWCPAYDCRLDARAATTLGQSHGHSVLAILNP